MQHNLQWNRFINYFLGLLFICTQDVHPVKCLSRAIRHISPGFTLLNSAGQLSLPRRSGRSYWGLFNWGLPRRAPLDEVSYLTGALQNNGVSPTRHTDGG